MVGPEKLRFYVSVVRVRVIVFRDYYILNRSHYVIFDKLINLYEPQFLYLYNDQYNSFKFKDDVASLYILIFFLFLLWEALETVPSVVIKANKLTVRYFFLFIVLFFLSMIIQVH